MKNLASKHLDVSTPEGFFEIMYYLIKAAACPDTSGAQGTRILRVYEPPSKNPPEHSWSESRDNNGMRRYQGKVHTNRKTPPWTEMAYDPGPNYTIRTLVEPPLPPRKPPIYWHIEILP